MVLPLIPLVMMGVGAVTSVGGAALAGKGATDVKASIDRDRAARKDFDERRAKCEERVAETNAKLVDLGAQQEQSIASVVERMVDFLRRHERQVREHERLLIDGIDTTQHQVVGPGGISVSHAGLIGGAIGGGATAAGAGIGIAALAANFGVASTGTAISSLSGAAATNAVAALLGGGSLASGGGGMALGATALRFAKVGPAVLVGGLAVMVQGQRTLTQARRIETEVSVKIAEMDSTETLLDAIDVRVDELGSVLENLTMRGTEALDVLESEPFDPEEHATRFQRAFMLAKSVGDVAAAPVIDESGELTSESESLIVKYRTAGKEAADG